MIPYAPESRSLELDPVIHSRDPELPWIHSRDPLPCPLKRTEPIRFGVLACTRYLVPPSNGKIFGRQTQNKQLTGLSNYLAAPEAV